MDGSRSILDSTLSTFNGAEALERMFTDMFSQLSNHGVTIAEQSSIREVLAKKIMDTVGSVRSDSSGNINSYIDIEILSGLLKVILFISKESGYMPAVPSIINAVILNTNLKVSVINIG